MTNYQLINNNLPLVAKFINNGLMKIDVLKYIEIYEMFHSLTGTKTERYDKIAKEFGIKAKTVQMYILKMDRKVK